MLTKQDIQALRTANTIVFHCDDNAHCVRALKEHKADAVFDQSGRHHTTERLIALTGTITNAKRVMKDIRCVDSLNYTDSDATWQTIVKSLRPDDEISLEWYQDAHTNQYMSEHGLHGDVLYLHTSRKSKARGKYMISAQCCPDNTARMIRS